MKNTISAMYALLLFASWTCVYLALAFEQSPVATTTNSVLHLRTTPKVLPSSGSWVTVSWANISAPTFGDVLAVYPAGYEDGNLRSQLQPVKLVWPSQVADSTWLNGTGTARIWLVNHRIPLQVLYIKGNGYSANIFGPSSILAAKSEPIEFANPNEPLHGRLSLTGKTSEMAVTWQVKPDPAIPLKPRVQYGTRPGKYTKLALGEPLTLKASDLCGDVASNIGWLDPGSINTAVMTGLIAGQKYYYRYGDPGYGWSKEFSFRMAPGQDPSATVRVLAMADVTFYNRDGSQQPEGDVLAFLMNSLDLSFMPFINPTTTYGALYNAFLIVYGLTNPSPSSMYTFLSMSDDLDQQDADVVIHNGDISYARGMMAQWDIYLNNLMPIATRVPYMLSIGNHEYGSPNGKNQLFLDYDSGGECGVTTARLLPQPYQSVPDRLYYSFNVGPIHFLQMSTEVNFSAGSTQHQWVLSDLSSLNRSLSPWVVVGMHRPMYSDDFDCCEFGGIQGTALELQAALEEMFYIYGVDMVWTGHTHAYTRTCPVFNGTCQGWTEDGQALAPVHVLFGNGGNGITPSTYPSKPEWAEVSNFEYGYSVVDANATHLSFKAKSSMTKRIFDRVTLTKPQGWALDVALNKQRLLQVQAALTYPLLPFTGPSYTSTIGLIFSTISLEAYQPPATTTPLQEALFGPGTPANFVASNYYLNKVNLTLLPFWYLNQACCVYVCTSPLLMLPSNRAAMEFYCGLYQPGGRIYNMTVEQSGVAPTLVVAFNGTLPSNKLNIPWAITQTNATSDPALINPTASKFISSMTNLMGRLRRPGRRHAARHLKADL